MARLNLKCVVGCWEEEGRREILDLKHNKHEHKNININAITNTNLDTALALDLRGKASCWERLARTIGVETQEHPILHSTMRGKAL